MIEIYIPLVKFQHCAKYFLDLQVTKRGGVIKEMSSSLPMGEHSSSIPVKHSVLIYRTAVKQLVQDDCTCRTPRKQAQS